MTKLEQLEQKQSMFRKELDRMDRQRDRLYNSATMNEYDRLMNRYNVVWNVWVNMGIKIDKLTTNII